MPEIAQAHVQAPEMTSLTSDNFFLSIFLNEQNQQKIEYLYSDDGLPESVFLLL